MPIHKTISVDSEEFWNECMKIANREGKPLSTIIMDGLKQYMKIHGDGNPVYALDKWIGNPDFKAVPATMSPKEKFIGFCQHTSDETLKELEYQGMMIQVIARCYLRLDPKERETRFFPNLRQMEVFGNGF
jgi:hypothetical protein